MSDPVQESLEKSASEARLFSLLAEAVKGLEALDDVRQVVVNPIRREIVVLGKDLRYVAVRGIT